MTHTTSTIERRSDGFVFDDEDCGQLTSVIYSSIATVPFGPRELAGLLAVTRRNNPSSGLTGLLLHRDGQFMQVLEGPERAVHAMLATIAADPRHTGVWVLGEERLEHRMFPDWAMGYRDADHPWDTPGYNDTIFADEALDVKWITESRSQALIDWFRRR